MLVQTKYISLRLIPFLPSIDDAAGYQLVSITLLSEAHYEDGFFEVPQFSIPNDDMAGS